MNPSLIFMGAIRNGSALALCVEISRDVMSGAYYKALMSCKKLFEFERERLNYDSQSVPKHAVNY